MTDTLVCMAEIVGVHGIKGLVKLKIHAGDPQSLLDYKTFTDSAQKRSFVLSDLQNHGNIFLARLDGVNDRTAAEKLRGTKLHVARAALPAIAEENTFYHVDLIGLAALYPDGAPLGRIVGVANFGAGDLLEIKPVKGASFYVPFTDAVVPKVDMEAKTVTVAPPPGLLD